MDLYEGVEGCTQGGCRVDGFGTTSDWGRDSVGRMEDGKAIGLWLPQRWGPQKGTWGLREKEEGHNKQCLSGEKQKGIEIRRAEGYL